MSRITNVVESFKKTGLIAVRGFGSGNRGCGLIAHVMARHQLITNPCDESKSYERLSELAGVSRDYAISFTWGFDSRASRASCMSFKEWNEEGFNDGVAAAREVAEAGLFGGV